MHINIILVKARHQPECKWVSMVLILCHEVKTDEWTVFLLWVVSVSNGWYLFSHHLQCRGSLNAHFHPRVWPLQDRSGDWSEFPLQLVINKLYFKMLLSWRQIRVLEMIRRKKEIKSECLHALHSNSNGSSWCQSFGFLYASLSCSHFVYRNGLARGGSEYGPLTDLPDWSYTGKI